MWANRLALAWLLVFSLAAIAVAPLLGPTHIEPAAALADAWARLTGRPVADPIVAQILALRMPRICLGWLAGAGLAVAGAAFQGLFRNPLATPYTSGVVAAASLGAAAVILCPGITLGVVGHLGVGAAALAAALLETGLLALLALRTAGLHMEGILLAGITFNFLATALLLLLRALTAAPLQLLYLDRWLMGGLDVVGWDWLPLIPAATVGVVVLLLFAPALDQLALSHDVAASRGVRVAQATAGTLLAAALVTAAVVAAVGPIGFVGLLVPNGVRNLLGASHPRLLLGSLLAGGGFLVLCDGAVRLLSAGRVGGELPVGVLTALLGGPLFLILLVRSLRGPR
jgi:iron complex transport system permease protein